MTFLPLALMVLAGPPAMDPAIREVMQIFASDPPVAEVQRAALEHFRLSQDDISGYRVTARLKALMPSVSGSFSQGDDRSTAYSTDQVQFGAPWDPNNPQSTNTSSGLGRNYSASVSWDLKSLVFDSQQLEAYSLVGIHEEIVKEVTRLYFTRQHNLLAIALDPPKDPRALAAIWLRTREIESLLDAMTGGQWSELRKGGAR
jgi:hypothetical protein